MILSNQVKCHTCGEAPWSAHRHDYVRCACIIEAQRVCVDGGMDYLRRVYGPDSAFEDISIEVSDEHFDGLMRAITDPVRNDLGKLCNVVRYLRDEMDINISAEELEDDTD